MTKVKICGITNLHDAMLCAEAGADAVGFVFAKSPRRASLSTAKAISLRLPPFISTVGVFVNAHLDPDLLRQCMPFLHAVQLHGDEPPDFVEGITKPKIKGFRIGSKEDLKAIESYVGKVNAVLLDARVEGAEGGTGQTFDWTIAAEARKFGIPIILAGGLHPGNVAEAISAVKPYAVDASSLLEISPGRKDPGKIRRFVQEVRRADLKMCSGDSSADD